MDKMDLSGFRVKNAPGTVYYIPDFISPEEEQQLMTRVYQAPKTKWTVLSRRRLQNWGGLPGPKGMVAEDLPQWLQVYGQKITELGAFEGKLPNHVLVNEYLSGQGIMPHEDGPAFFPTVSTISLGSHTLLDFYYHLNASATTGDDPPSTTTTTTTTVHANSHHPGENATDETKKDDPMEMGEPSRSPRSAQGKEGNSEEQCAHSSSSSSAGACLGGGGSGVQRGECENQTDGHNSMDKRHFLSLLLQPRSLLLLQDDMYKVHLHGIREVAQDCITDKVANLDLLPEVKVGDVMERKTRVSLTIRLVPKVLKSRLILGKRK